MPIYEYECLDCKNHFEELQSFDDDPIEKCPSCGGRARKLISSSAALIFRGSGFYITDYKKKENSSGLSKPEAETTSDKTESSKPSSSSSTASSPEKSDSSSSAKSDES